MPKQFRIIKVLDPELRFAVQFRERFLFIPYWDYLRDFSFNGVVLFYSYSEALKAAKEFSKGKIVSIREEEKYVR